MVGKGVNGGERVIGRERKWREGGEERAGKCATEEAGGLHECTSLM